MNRQKSQVLAGKKSDSLRIQIWGARGSLPTPFTPIELESHIRCLFEQFIYQNNQVKSDKRDVELFLSQIPRYQLGGYGGHTPCVEVNSPHQQIIIDGGSGLRVLGQEMLKGPSGRGLGEIHILFTHFHWDHLMGLPFFAPLFIPGNKIHVYSVQPDLKKVFRTLFKKPYFPVPLRKVNSQIQYHTLKPRETFYINDIAVTPYQLDHPDPCWGFRMEQGGRVYAHCVDTECIRTTREELGLDLPLYQNVDLMLFDAQYTLSEAIEKANWGHAAAPLGLDIAMREGIKRVIFIHHDPAASNAMIAAAEDQTLRYYQKLFTHAQEALPHLESVDWAFGYEGMVLEV